MSNLHSYISGAGGIILSHSLSLNFMSIFLSNIIIFNFLIFLSTLNCSHLHFTVHHTIFTSEHSLVFKFFISLIISMYTEHNQYILTDISVLSGIKDCQITCSINTFCTWNIKISRYISSDSQGQFSVILTFSKSSSLKFPSMTSMDSNSSTCCERGTSLVSLGEGSFLISKDLFACNQVTNILLISNNAATNITAMQHQKEENDDEEVIFFSLKQKSQPEGHRKCRHQPDTTNIQELTQAMHCLSKK